MSLARLLALPRFLDAASGAYRPGLERVRALLAEMGDPHERLRVVHVAGTNGKGSTASFVSAIGTASRLRVGLFTSPTLLDRAEAVRIDGVPQPEALASGAARWMNAAERVGATYFEALTALALDAFARAAVDLAVVEAGLGGRDDATNVVRPAVAAVTHVGLDHTRELGGTPEAIARHKAGIAKPGVPFLHALPPGAERGALEAEAHVRDASRVERVRETVRIEASGGSATFTTPEAQIGPARLGLRGAHQAQNAALALRAAEVALGPLAPEAAGRGLAEVRALAGLRARGERWAGDPRIVLDVAHNAEGWALAVEGAAADSEASGGRLWALVGVLDKNPAPLARALAARGVRVLAVGLPSARAVGAEPLAAALREGGAEAEAAGSVGEGLARFRREAGPGDRLLVTGSHVTVSQALAALEGAVAFPESPRRTSSTS